MRVFVAGSNGQVAQALAEAANTRGIELVTAGRPDFDITDPASMQNAIDAFKPTAIINAAAYTAVDAAESDEDAAMAINCTGAGRLARMADKLDIPFLHLSTDYVFDGTKETPYTEDDYTRPTGVYGRTKLAGEIAVLAEHERAIILRTAWVYSPFGKNFVKTMLALAANRDELGVVADQVGNPTSASDIATALIDILSVLEAAGDWRSYTGTYHLAGTGSTSWHGFACETFDLSSYYDCKKPVVNAITTSDYPTPAARPANSRLDCSKLEKSFGVRLPTWQESLKECVKRLCSEQQVS